MSESLPECLLSGSHHTILEMDLILLCMLDDTGKLVQLSSLEPVKYSLDVNVAYNVLQTYNLSFSLTHKNGNVVIGGFPMR